MRYLPGALLVLLCVPAVQAQPATRGTEPAVLPLARLHGPVTLDGRSDEPAWAAVTPLPLTVNLPVFEGTPTEGTEIRIAYDDAYLYAAGRFFDSEPAGIRGNSMARDRGSDSDDYFALILDTFNDNENALAFLTTPAGIRIDQTVFNDANVTFETMPINESWNTFWDVVTVQDSTGWFAELRIPLSSLRFQDDDGHVVMGLLTWRWISRKSEGHTFPPVPNRWVMGIFKPSIARDVSMEGIRSRKPLYITPYALGGFGRNADLNEAETAYEVEEEFTQDLGLDLKYSLTSNLTLDLTANTDFAQVEADDQQVNLTRFSLFFPEKRLFFQERASIFEFNTGGPTRLFYSRRIGLSDDGPVPLYGGLRLVGRVGDWDLGLLNMQSARQNDLPAENFGVLRFRRQVLNPNSYVGGIGTSRLGHDGTYNYAYGVDGTIRLRNDDYLVFSMAQSFENSLLQNDLLRPFNTSQARLRFERRANDGFSYDLGVGYVGEDYNPGLGFVLRTGVTRIGDELAYTWQTRDTSPVLNHRLGAAGFAFLRNSDGQVESAEAGPQYFLLLRSGGFAFLQPRMVYEALDEPFELDDDVEVPAREYTYYDVQGMYQMGPRLVRTEVMLNAGGFYDGWRASLTLAPTWNVSRLLELSAEAEFNRVRFPDRDVRFAADVFRLRATMALNIHFSFSTFTQFNTLSDDVSINTRLRYNFREGNDLYLVYNEGLNTDRLSRTPRPPLTGNRAVLVKYTYTFVR
jgi:hypothetical protein